MIPPGIPDSEPARLRALAALEILDTPVEQRYDRIVRLASRTVDAPIAYISFVDANRQWLKSNVGMPVCETSRDVSFCGHTILHQEPLVIPDARADARFRDNPLVVDEPFIRFYTGVPLQGPGGHAVGTLCVAGPEPRQPSARQLDMLVEFASLVERELSLVDAIEAQRKLLDAQEALSHSHERMAEELERAARYVRSLLPAPLEGPVTTAWRYVPSAALGGDIFDTFQLPDGRTVAYIVDVAGHGVGSALLSVSVMNLIRAGAVPGADLGEPASVLAGLNRAFPMRAHDNKFFTAWYGVYDPRDRILDYASGGHHPALVLRGGDGDRRRDKLEATGLLVGAMPRARWRAATLPIEEPVTLYLFSDGVYEIFPPHDDSGETMLGYDGFADLLAEHDDPPSPEGLDAVLQGLRSYRGSPVFTDDVSLLRLRFVP